MKPLRTLLLEAADLMSDDAENEEYDRAIVELVGSTLGLTTDDFDTVKKMLRALRT